MGKFRGYQIELTDGDWVYSDTGLLVSEDKLRVCGYCNKKDERNGVDACLGMLPGVSNACCGHGSHDESYVVFSNGTSIRGFSVDPPTNGSE